MDSSFVNYDGRSVHDMIENLLAASGDPEAIRRLQESINAVDQRAQSSIAVVNAAIEQLEDDKQDAGNYCTFNGVVQTEMLLATMSNYRMQLVGTNEDTSKSMMVVEPEGKRILLYDKTAEETNVSLKATFTADEDTGWQTLEDTSIKYRKKNGFVSYNLATGVSQYSFTSGQWVVLGTMPVGFRPLVDVMTTFWYRKTATGKFDQMLCQLVADGRIQVLSTETINASDINSNLLSVTFPV